MDTLRFKQLLNTDQMPFDFTLFIQSVPFVMLTIGKFDTVRDTAKLI